MNEPPGARTDADQANPYIAGSPIAGSEMFFGRDDVFDFVREAMVGRHRDNVIVLYGQRRTGKTSILYQLQRQLGERYVCVFIDLHALALDGLGGALWELATSITRALRRLHQIELPRQERAAFMDDPRAQFENEFLGQVMGAIGDRHLLLMLDEVVRLQEQIEAGKLDKAIFPYLRHLMQHHDRLSFLFSLGSGLEQMSAEYSLLFSVALYKKISFLDHASAVALARRPVASLYDVEPDAIDRILELTCGQPYFTQLVCHSLFNRWQHHRTEQIAAEDVDAVIDEAVERGLAVLKHIWEESTPGEKAVVAAMAAVGAGGNPPIRIDQVTAVWLQRGVEFRDRELSSAVQSLIARDVIAGADAYTFSVDLQRRWISQYRRVEWVHEEIANALAGLAPTAPHEDVSPPVPPTRRRPSPLLSAIGTGGLALIVVVGLFVWSRSPATPQSSLSTPVPIATSAAPVTVAGAVTVATALPILAGDAASVNGLAAGGDEIWAATEGGLVRWTLSGVWQLLASAQGSGFGFQDDNRETIAVATDGTLWIGGGGVAHVGVNGTRLTRINYYDRDVGLGMGVVHAVMVDSDGSVWASGIPDSGKPPPLSHFDGQQHPDGNAWHTLDVPLDRAPVTGTGLNIWSMARARDGSLWLGLATAGVLRWDGAHWTHFAAVSSIDSSSRCATDMRVRRLVEDRQGAMWAAGTCQGLLRLDPAAGRAQQVQVAGSPRIVQALALSSRGELWVAGPDLVAMSTDDGQTWTLMGTTSDALGTDISSLVEGPDGSIWLGDYSQGVSVFDGRQWRHLQR